MPTITIRGLDAQVKVRLKRRAAENGRSMEAEARRILGEAVAPAHVEPLGQAMVRRFAGGACHDLEVPDRSDAPRSAEFGA